MGKLNLLFFVISLTMTLTQAFQIGLGRADVTGPAAEVHFMGYAETSQRGEGIHLRQYARAFIIQDNAGRRVAYISAEIAGISAAMRRDVISALQQRFGNIYNFNNVMIAATHTHGGPGGLHQLVLYDVTCLGFIESTYTAFVNGIVNAVANAHNSMFSGRVFLSEANVANVGRNRSPYAYDANPQAEKNRYSSNMDLMMQQLRFVDNQNQLRGAFHWLAIHAVSMNNTNRLVSTDNFGVAALLLEQEFNPGQLVGQGTFVGGFATAHSGDVSPNTERPRCFVTGEFCDGVESFCPGRDNWCVAFGPGGGDHFESTRIIGSRVHAVAASMLRANAGRELSGNVGSIHQFINMPEATGTYTNPNTGQVENVRGCMAAMGHSFAAGTTDGPGGFNFTQGDTSGNAMWDAVTNFLATPTADDVICHHPKPILLMTGRTSRPYQWTPSILPTQIFTIGDVVIVGLAGEFTTMAGRRVRSQIQSNFGSQRQVILSGLTNIYSSYVVTPEEYQVQRYEGASTLYGPHTLTLLLLQYNRLMTALVNGQTLAPGPSPLDERSSQMTFLTPVLNDDSGSFQFGQCIVQPNPSHRRGEQVFASFVSGNPRNNLQTGSSFFFVEQQQTNGLWTVIATDANWETRFIWRRTSTLLGRSEIDFLWDIPAIVANGVYRIRHIGTSRGPVTGLRDYVGLSNTFTIA